MSRRERAIRAEYNKYRRMGYDHATSKAKAIHHHTMKL